MYSTNSTISFLLDSAWKPALAPTTSPSPSPSLNLNPTNPTKLPLKSVFSDSQPGIHDDSDYDSTGSESVNRLTPIEDGLSEWTDAFTKRNLSAPDLSKHVSVRPQADNIISLDAVQVDTLSSDTVSVDRLTSSDELFTVDISQNPILVEAAQTNDGNGSVVCVASTDRHQESYV
eukprot:m.174943 g.174943  ORF g.174943 m.174943 type:complete len:175 (-) comp31789_c3_seq2:1031-1555(-)